MENYSEPLPVSIQTICDGKVGLVTVTYNSGTVLHDFLRSVDALSYRNFVLIAVDNASADDTLDQLRSWDTFKLIVVSNTKNLGVAAGNNQGIQAALDAGCDYVLLINNDVVFGPELLTDLLSGMAQQSCDIVTPLIYFYAPPTKIWAAGGQFQPLLGYRTCHRGENEIDAGQYSRASKISYAPTCCVLIRESVFRQIGLMDERYFVYSDDVDFMYRASRAKLSMVLIPEAKLWHKVSSLAGGSTSDFSIYYGARGRSLFLCKHFGWFAGTVWVLAYLAFYWLRPLLGMDTVHRGDVRRRGTWDGRKIGLNLGQNARI